MRTLVPPVNWCPVQKVCADDALVKVVAPQLGQLLIQLPVIDVHWAVVEYTPTDEAPFEISASRSPWRLFWFWVVLVFHEFAVSTSSHQVSALTPALVAAAYA